MARNMTSRVTDSAGLDALERGHTIGQDRLKIRGEPLLRSVWGKALRGQNRSLIGWVIGLIGLVVIYLSSYPIYRDDPAFSQQLDALPEALTAALGLDGDLTAPEGYISTTLFGFLVPLIFIAYAIGSGVRAIAGDEDRGNLDMLLALPLARARFVTERFLAMVTVVIGLGTLMWLSMVIMAHVVDIEIGVARLAAPVVGVALLGLVFGTLAFALGGVSGRPSSVLGATIAVAISTYLFSALSAIATPFASLRYLSPFHYATGNDPITNGLRLGNTLVLLVLIGLGFAVALVRFNRRDLAV